MTASSDELKARRLARLEGLTVSPPPVDLEGLTCLDLGHRWYQTELGRQHDGVLRGLPARVCVCGVCDCTRIDVLTWAGAVVSRWYVHDPAWLEAMRTLDPDDHWARRGEYRRRLLAAESDSPDSRKRAARDKRANRAS